MSSPEPQRACPSSTRRRPPCRHLRNKGMYVYTDGISGESHDDYDNTIYWCLKTMKSFGPDDEFVSRRRLPEYHAVVLRAALIDDRPPRTEPRPGRTASPGRGFSWRYEMTTYRRILVL